MKSWVFLMFFGVFFFSGSPLLFFKEVAAIDETPETVDADRFFETELRVPNRLDDLPEGEVALFSQEKKPIVANPERSDRIVYLMALCLVLLGGLFFVYKKMRNVGSPEQIVKIKLMSQFHFSPKKSLAVVDVKGQQLLIGLTDQNISMLRVLHDPSLSFDDQMDHIDESVAEHEIPPPDIPDDLHDRVAMRSPWGGM